MNISNKSNLEECFLILNQKLNKNSRQSNLITVDTILFPTVTDTLSYTNLYSQNKNIKSNNARTKNETTFETMDSIENLKRKLSSKSNSKIFSNNKTRISSKKVNKNKNNCFILITDKSEDIKNSKTDNKAFLSYQSLTSKIKSKLDFSKLDYIINSINPNQDIKITNISKKTDVNYKIIKKKKSQMEIIDSKLELLDEVIVENEKKDYLKKHFFQKEITSQRKYLNSIKNRKNENVPALEVKNRLNENSKDKHNNKIDLNKINIYEQIDENEKRPFFYKNEKTEKICLLDKRKRKSIFKTETENENKSDEDENEDEFILNDIDHYFRNKILYYSNVCIINNQIHEKIMSLG